MPTREPQRRFALLLHKHRKVVFKVAGLYSRNAADRDDLVQKKLGLSETKTWRPRSAASSDWLMT